MLGKLLLILAVVAIGAVVLGPALDAMTTGTGGGDPALIAGAAVDLDALTIATVLAVYKPGGRRSTRKNDNHTTTTTQSARTSRSAWP